MLPDEVRSILEEMRAERIRGAGWLAMRGAEAYMILAGLLEGDELKNALREMRTEVPAVNRTMASLYNLSRFIPITGNPEVVRTKAEEFVRLAGEAKREIGNIGSELIDENEVIITHSFSSAVLEIFKAAKRKGKHFRVVLTESAPDYEGIALARELDSLGVPFEVITDAQLGLFARKATLALVGADNVTRDGAVVNKAGTYLLALACHDNGVPFYVAAESFKLHPGLTSEEVEIVERPYMRQGYRVRNLLFDVTPWRYVRGVITEFGILVPPKEI
ncbi:translation initiation factor eIF-2B alpha/beta/delta subunit family protein [Thermococcus thioreducens]|uniref:Translation initiation factor IF-2B subunit alpha n=1 Tax=Thermococcus thioreducens TaxID=277988 RepID=A0A0Q2QSZ7_9EURY|nr:translation initiation factor IF-2B subunit alpha [Thermococcus thioreducens]ASJ12428.1 translation initiation factor IF-2B subunit alpha [Thermococcus thioreducens]KQH83157.1 translation initiation factor IF-2B subunit alpha [Thermococcus thioreducens]SEV91023.1 translation initiation factor eIF-2B subunit delta [Thermococcus thioreducens]